MKVNILGTDYEIVFKDYKDDKLFEKYNADGYCGSIDKLICVCNRETHPNSEDDSKEICSKIEKEVLRHEIVHAFLNESGLQSCSAKYNDSWAENEEMVDWIALQFPKILKAFEEVKAL